jgi:hypothetical protein
MNAAGFPTLVLAALLLSGCGNRSGVPSTPDGTVSKFTSDMADDKPQVIWHCLPAKYQADVKEVIREFAGKMDPEVWNKSFATLGKAAEVLDKKKEFVLGMADQGPVPISPDQREQLDQQWDRVVGIFEDLINSDIKTVDGLKKLDPEKFLATTGSKFSKNIKDLAAAVGDEKTAAKIDNLKETKTTVVKSGADKATVKVEITGEQPQEIEMVKVDGKWLPADMVANWDTHIAQMKSSIAQMEISGEAKDGALAMIGTCDQVFDKMLAAETQEEFSQAASGLMPMVFGMMGPGVPGLGGPGPNPPQFPPPDFSTPATPDSSEPEKAKE